MTDQTALWTDDILDACADVIRALGGPKTVGPMMRSSSEMPALQAQKWVLSCLDKNRAERFSPDQVMWLLREGRKVGCHSLMNYLADEGGYARPSPVEPKDEEAELMRQFIRSVEEQRKIAERLERRGVRLVG